MSAIIRLAESSKVAAGVAYVRWRRVEKSGRARACLLASNDRAGAVGVTTVSLWCWFLDTYDNGGGEQREERELGVVEQKQVTGVADG